MIKENKVYCKHCHSEKVVKFGTFKNVQRYWCQACRHKFKNDGRVFHTKISPDIIGSALEMYYTGISIGEICKRLKSTQGYYPSKSVVYYWQKKFTNLAVQYFQRYIPKVSNTWVCDETLLDMANNKKVWYWDILDTQTRFLIAVRVSGTRTPDDFKKLIESAYKRTGKMPRIMISDKGLEYWGSIPISLSSNIKLILGGDVEYALNRPLMERNAEITLVKWCYIQQERNRDLRALRNINALTRFIDGFFVHYNFFRQHEAMSGNTPAEMAKIEYKVRNWADFVRI